jgi:hypothetical protein
MIEFTNIDCNFYCENTQNDYLFVVNGTKKSPNKLNPMRCKNHSYYLKSNRQFRN